MSEQHAHIKLKLKATVGGIFPALVNFRLEETHSFQRTLVKCQVWLFCVYGSHKVHQFVLRKVQF